MAKRILGVIPWHEKQEQIVVADPEREADALLAAHEPLIESWLHGKSIHSQRAYRRDIRRLFLATSKPLGSTSLVDLQEFDRQLQTCVADASRARILAAVKSLLSFAQRVGLLQMNVGAVLKLPRFKDTLAERILSESAVQRMLAKEEDPRNHALLLLLYKAGIRREELCRLCWRDIQERVRPDGQITVQVVAFGKGGKTRAIVLKPETWEELQSLLPRGADDAPVFLSRQRSADGSRALKPAQVYNIVKEAAERAGIQKMVSPHWMRHAHASHALNRGAPISLVSQTLGHANIATTGRYTHAQPDMSSAEFLP